MDIKLLLEQCNQAISEGIYDPAIFKAIFTAGGPGSGKSFITNQVTGGLGFKIVNSDDAFELYMRKAGKSLKLAGSTDDYTPIRNKAVRTTASKFQAAITPQKDPSLAEGRLGLILDGTGADMGKLLSKKRRLENIGYDTYMLFINTTLETALARNRSRERTLDDKIVISKWNEVQENLPMFRTLFKKENGVDRFILINNDAPVEDQKELLHKVYVAFMKIAKRPLQNPIAVEWVENELERRRHRYSEA